MFVFDVLWDENSFFNSLLNVVDAAQAVLADSPPDWLIEELANDGVAIHKYGCEWILGALGE